jgi:DNA-binding response OmpR family regulator
MSDKRILIIDDEPELCELMRIAFETRDFKVYTAQDGEEGLETAVSRKPNAIVLDLKMPRVNGYEFLARARKEPRVAEIPIVVLTSLTENSGRSDKQWAESMEVDCFISKPVEPFELVERVEQVLNAE